MTIANFEYPINLYNGSLSLEDWLANFSVEVDKVSIETPPPAKTNPLITVAIATFCPTLIGEQTIYRADLVSMFSEKEVREQELEASYNYLENML